MKKHEMTEEEAVQLHWDLENMEDDGEAAKSHLAAGRPIYYCEDAYPDHMIRQWPDSRRELVTLDAMGKIHVVMSLEGK